MFFDPALSFPMLHAALFLLKKKLGFRALMKVIPLNGDQVKGSHGRDNVPDSPAARLHRSCRPPGGPFSAGRT